MFDWLTKLPIWFQIIFSFISLGFIIVGIFIIAKKGLRIRARDKDIIIGAGAHDVKIKISPHKNCIHNKDIIIMLNESSQIIQEKFYLSFVKQMREQMTFAETKIDQIRLLAQKAYLGLLEQKGVTDLVSSVSYASYRSILVELQDQILRHIRNFFRENHYANFTESNFQIYVRTKVEFIKGETTDLFNRLYFYKEHITREDLYDLNRGVVQEAAPILIEIFEMARLIAIETKLKEKEYDQKLKDLLSHYLDLE